MPEAARISPVSVVVVVLPLEPVMARMLPLRNCAASSSSPMTVNPKALTWTSSGVSSGTPGLTTIRSWRRKVSRPWPPDSTMMPCSRRAGISLAKAAAERMSETVTCAPCWRRNRAADRPDLPNPTTRTFLPFNSIRTPALIGSIANSNCGTQRRCGCAALAEFERGECKQCKHQGRNPEADDDFGFAPAEELEVMVQRSHLEDTLLAQLVAAHLQNNGKGLEHEDAADEREQQLLANDDCDGGDGSAEGERADIAHEDFSGMGVVPEKADGGADHRSAEDGDLADQGHALEFEVVGKDDVAADVGEHGERAGGDDGAADSQAVEAVGEVDGIRGAHEDEDD